MSFTRWLARLCARPITAPRNQPGARRLTARPEILVLEDRLAPALLTVNSLADGPLSASSPILSLREAVALINSDGSATDAAGRSLAAAKASQINTNHPFGSGDTIRFDPHLFTSGPRQITLRDGELLLNRSVNLVGPGAGLLALSGNDLSRVFEIDGGALVRLIGLTVEDGNAASANGTGGGIANWGGTLTLAYSTVANNLAARGGGIANTGTLRLVGSTVSGNVADDWGGVVNYGTLTATGSTISGNAAVVGAGLVNTGTATLTDCTVSGNAARNDDGGVLNTGVLTLAGSTVSGNSAVVGNGGVANYAGTLTLTDSTVSGNSARWLGGVGNYGGTMTITGSTLTGNKAGDWAGVINYGTLTVSGSTVSDNSARNDGGGIVNFGGTLTITGSTVRDNSASQGGGILNTGTLSASNSRIVKNGGGNLVGPGTFLDAGNNRVGHPHHARAIVVRALLQEHGTLAQAPDVQTGEMATAGPSTETGMVLQPSPVVSTATHAELLPTGTTPLAGSFTPSAGQADADPIFNLLWFGLWR